MRLLAHYKHKRWLQVFVIYLRYLVGGAYVFSAMPKILGERFMSQNGEDAPINTFPHFFETLYRSGIYWEFLGWSQVLAALFLMTQVFATFGAVAFLAISINVFMITITYPFAGTPVITGLMLLSNCFLLLWDYPKLAHLVIPDKPTKFIIINYYDPYYNHRFWMFLGFILFSITVVYVIYFGRNPVSWFLISVFIGFAGWIYMRMRFPQVKTKPKARQ